MNAIAKNFTTSPSDIIHLWHFSTLLIPILQHQNDRNAAAKQKQKA